MIALNSFFATLLITIFVASTAEAAPWPVHARHSTHRTRSLGKRATKLDTYHPKSTFQTFKPDATLQGRAFTDLRTSCMEWVQNRLGLEADGLQWQSGVTNSVGQYGFVKQSLNGIAVSNAVANVAFKDGQAVTFGSSFVNATSVADAKPTISEAAAVAAAEESADGKANDQAVRIEYIITQGGAAELAYAVQVQNAKTGAFQEIFVNAHNGQILSMNDFVADATYKVLPIEKVTLDQGFETLTDPEDIAASPLGWHDDGTTQSTTTTGNNVVAFLASNQQAVTSASAGNNANNLVFDFDHNPAADPNVGQNADLAVTNAFYLMNTIHDITYRYGFTEAAFNFQSNNFNKGGRAGDPVLMDVQDASGVNNAAFATPPDGQSGQCQMFIWTLTQPNRDGSLENDIPIHEMMHGVTNRMTGGGTGRCLQTLEAGGMGEGWSDAMADWMQQSSATVTDFSLGTFVTNNPAGIRSAPYSTSKATNALTYGSLRTRNQVHEIGEVWANMLHNVYAALVAAKGFSQDAKTNPDATGGNAVFLRLLMDALLLQPCNPTFVQARDAFVSADIARFNGENTCTVLAAFASRGLGANAGPDFVDDNTVGNGCA